MSYCKICGNTESPRSEKYPIVCVYCEKYVEHCAICGRTVTENGDGFNFQVTETQLEKLKKLNIKHKKNRDDTYCFWLCASFEPWIARYCFERHLEGAGDPVNKIISLHERGIQNVIDKDNLQEAILNGVVLDKHGSKVEPDHPDSPISDFI